MIMKLMGTALILFSTSMTGYYFSQVDKYRMEDLREMKNMLTILKGEIVFSATPLGEAFLEISKRVSGVIAEISEKIGEKLSKKNGESAAVIWQETLTEYVHKSYFTKEDMEAFFSFGRVLGYLDRQQQISNIELTLFYINQTEEQLLEKSAKSSKIYKSMGVLFGALIAVILF